LDNERFIVAKEREVVVVGCTFFLSAYISEESVAMTGCIFSATPSHSGIPLASSTTSVRRKRKIWMKRAGNGACPGHPGINWKSERYSIVIQ
jgi:hypothetical protein